MKIEHREWQMTWRMRVLVLCVILVAAAGAAFEASAQDTAGDTAPAQRRYTDQYTVEFLGEVRFNATLEEDDDKFFDLAIAPGIGFFMVKGLQIGLQPQFRFQRDVDAEDGALDIFLGGAGLFVNYVIDVRSIVFPFLGVAFAALGGKADSTYGGIDFNVIDVGPQIGLKIVAGKNGILTLAFSYAFESQADDLSDNRFEMHKFWVGMGIGFWL